MQEAISSRLNSKFSNGKISMEELERRREHWGEGLNQGQGCIVRACGKGPRILLEKGKNIFVK